MNAPLENAAQGLLAALNAPRGAINTQVLKDEDGPFIRVSIDPLYWFWAARVPAIYRGYRVFVEERQPVLAHA